MWRSLRPYLAAFLITAAMFLAAFGVTALFNRARLNELRAIEERLALDILSLETQFDLFEAASCTQLASSTPVTRELSELGARLATMEEALGVNDARVLQLKKMYSLLQIKDLVLLTKLAERCGRAPLPLLYFYSNAPGACHDCWRQGYVLTRLARETPSVRVYSFDYDLSLPALTTLKALYHIAPPLPVIVVGTSTRYTLHGFHTTNEIEHAVPILRTLRSTSTPPGSHPTQPEEQRHTSQ